MGLKPERTDIRSVRYTLRKEIVQDAHPTKNEENDEQHVQGRNAYKRDARMISPMRFRIQKGALGDMYRSKTSLLQAYLISIAEFGMDLTVWEHRRMDILSVLRRRGKKIAHDPR